MIPEIEYYKLASKDLKKLREMIYEMEMKMTKSQNTKNEQQKNLCITSEQLTKQLATESLPEYTEFYVRKKDGSTDTHTWLNRRHSSAVEWWNTFNITKVLAPVPSYDEWQLMQEDNKRLKHDVGNLGYKIKNQRHEIDNRLKEIDKLKELLKECKTPLEVYNEMFGNKEELLTKIDEVLK